MKTAILVIWTGFCTLSIIYINMDNQFERMKKLEEIQQSIERRTHLDSLYWNHLEHCTFIRNDSIGVGYQGYLYDKYHRIYKIQSK